MIYFAIGARMGRVGVGELRRKDRAGWECWQPGLSPQTLKELR